MPNLLHYFIYIVGSGVFIIALFVLAILLGRQKKIAPPYTRKIIHILFANWYFVPYFMVSKPEDVLFAIIPPLIFMMLNLLSWRYKIVKAIERDDQKELGTIIYPAAFALLIFLSNYVFQLPFVGLLGALVLGYGDGLAGMIGYRFSKDNTRKSFLGFLIMYSVTFVLSLVFTFIFNGFHYWYFAPIIALVGALFEYYGPYGIDNITVPLFVTMLYYFLTILVK